MKNSATDVTALLVEMMERVSDESIAYEKLNTEIERSRAIADLSKQAFSIWNLQLRAVEAKDAALRPENFDLPSALMKGV
jgi:hypothetical protein